MSVLTIIAALGLEQDKDLPEWFCVFAEGTGEVEGSGSFLVDRTAWEMAKRQIERRGIEVVFDYEHQTLHDVKAPAAGWCRDWRYTDGVGIEAKIDWTEEAARYLAKGEYRYYSPVFHVRQSDKRLIAVHSLALTNAPRTNHLKPLLAKLGAQLEEEDRMEDLLKKLIAKLGLAIDASAEDVLTAIAALKDKQKEVAAKIPGEVMTVLELKDDDSVSTVVASINALKQVERNMVPKDQLDSLIAKLAERDADELVAKAIGDGKITPDQKDWATNYAKGDQEGFKTFVSKAPQVVPVDKLPGKQGEAAAVELSNTVLTVAKQMGVMAEDLKKFGGLE